MGKAEASIQHPNLIKEPKLTSGNVSFNKDELRCLSIIKRQKARPGAITIPRRDVLSNEGFEAEIKELERSGLWEVRVHQPHRGTDPKGGNVVLYPTQLTTDLGGKVSQIRPGALDPILDLLPTIKTIESVRVLPNASAQARKLNGVVVKFDERKKGWWNELAELKMSYGRGLSVFELGMSFDEFCNKLQDFLNITYGFGKTVNGLKYVQFLIDDEGNPFMAIAAGPTYHEKKTISENLSNMCDLQRAIEFIEIINRITLQGRMDVAKSLGKMFGTGKVNLCTDSRYIDLNLENATVTSGGAMSSHNSARPFALGIGGILLHKTSENDDLVPIGSGSKYPIDSERIELPQGIARKNLEVKNVSDDHVEVVKQLTNGLAVTTTLEAVGIGFNSSWS